ncbi:MAG: NADP-dependent oxidoreductase [Parvularculales bacterium]
MSNIISKEIHLASRPNGMPKLSDFTLAENSLSQPEAGEFLVRNIWMSVDPYMRGRMMDRESYVPPFQIGHVLEGGSIGQVVASSHDDYAVGDYVSGMMGWREYFISNGDMMSKVDPSIAPIETFLGTLGMPGLTAYAGLLRVGALKDGENVFVSAASGAVGSVVCQIAKAKGCHVAGTAGSDEKCAWLEKEAGIDAAINYKTCGDLDSAIRRASPKGIDVCFENVGGAHLQAALNNMRMRGRIALCGMIDQYNNTAPEPGPNNLILAVGMSLKMEGFIVTNHIDMMSDFHRDMGQWITEGKIKWRQTVDEGIEKAPEAFLKLFTGDNFGKMLVKVGPDPAI